mmetsp:Transcript_100403/g.193808  ORF Transcript_100403/g.193808 Transcript_100403/m.193808 type:complete len:230 (-) Transcript_100403:20-709(-)
MQRHGRAGIGHSSRTNAASGQKWDAADRGGGGGEGRSANSGAHTRGAGAEAATDWSEANRRRGIGFNYESGSSSRRGRRSRSRREERRLQDGEQRRADKREQRKALWSAPAAAKTVPDPAGDDSSESEPDGSCSAAPRVRTEGSVGTASIEGSAAAGTANAWEHSNFSTASDKSKFLRLMGAKHVPLPTVGAMGAASAPDTRHQADLERQYWQGMRQQMGGRGRGLGAM